MLTGGRVWKRVAWLLVNVIVEIRLMETISETSMQVYHSLGRKGLDTYTSFLVFFFVCLNREKLFLSQQTTTDVACMGVQQDCSPREQDSADDSASNCVGSVR